MQNRNHDEECEVHGTRDALGRFRSSYAVPHRLPGGKEQRRFAPREEREHEHGCKVNGEREERACEAYGSAFARLRIERSTKARDNTSEVIEQANEQPADDAKPALPL